MKQIEMDITTFAYDNCSEEYISKRLSKVSLFNDYIEAPAIRELMSSYGSLENKNILDIGCGPGLYAKSFFNMGANVVAIDPSEKMIDVANNICKDCSFKGNKIEFFNRKFEDFSIEKKFQIIFATFMLGYFENLEKTFEKMKNLLGESGRIITSALHPERVFSTGRTKVGYISGGYDNKNMYEADFLGSGSIIKLHKHSFEEIINAANSVGLKVNRIKEPLLDPLCGYPDQIQVDFYSRNHSVVIFELSRK